MIILRKADGYVSRNVGDETIVVPVRAGVGDLESIFTMNAVGATIWNAMNGKVTIDELSRAVVEAFDVSDGEAAADVGAFVELLVSKGLAVVVSDGAGASGT